MADGREIFESRSGRSRNDPAAGLTERPVDDALGAPGNRAHLCRFRQFLPKGGRTRALPGLVALGREAQVGVLGAY